jgi:hypothetical protein
MTPIESMGFDLATLRTLTLGNGEISLPALSAFGSKTDELIRAVWATDRSNPPERQELKQDFVDLMRDHVWVPTIACAIYVFIVFAGPHFVRNPWPVRTWQTTEQLGCTATAKANLHVRHAGQAGSRRVELAALGVQCSRILPLHGRSARQRALIRLGLGACSPAWLSHHTSLHSFNQMAASGWRYTVCTEPKTINLVNTDLDVWACFFVLSKIFEFFDTILKILLKKDFIFLHWYHHLATAYLCWLSLAYNFAPGTWIAALNYTVHAPMYFYYFLSSVLSKKWFTIICKPVAPIITTMQTSQMAVRYFCALWISVASSLWCTVAACPSGTYLAICVGGHVLSHYDFRCVCARVCFSLRRCRCSRLSIVRLCIISTSRSRCSPAQYCR